MHVILAFFFIFRFFIVYKCIAVGDPVIKKEGLVSALTPPYVCACPKPGLGFPTSYVVVFFVFSEFS
jgi:hypothetical protein